MPAKFTFMGGVFCAEPCRMASAIRAAADWQALCLLLEQTTKIKEKEMPQYIITYLGGDQPSSPEEGKQHFSKYVN